MPQFLDPTALWYLAAALPAITALYFLKLRRQERVVSSTLLWRRSVHDLRVNAPVQMIRRNLLLLLQLLIATLVILALARPFTRLPKASGRQAALILDCSASMGTRDETGGKTRLEAAQEEALKLIENLGLAGENASDADELCVIAAGDRAEVLCRLTSDKERLREAVRSVRLTAGATNMAKAVQEAVNVTRVEQRVREKQEAGEVAGVEKKPGVDDRVGLKDDIEKTKANLLILSDGAFEPIPQRLAEKVAGAAGAPAGGEADIAAGSRFVRFGKPESDNLAIVSADLRSDPAGVAGRQVFVRVENMSAEAKQTRLNLSLDGKFLDSKQFSVPPLSQPSGEDAAAAPGQAGVVFDLAGDAEGVIKLQLESDDSLPVDNTAYAVVAIPEPISALLVSEGNFFIENSVKAMQQTLACESMLPSAYPQDDYPRRKDGKSYEIIVFDRFSPAKTPPGASLYLDAVPNLPGVTEDAKESPLFAPLVVDWKQGHPLMQNLTLLDKLSIRKCRKLVFSGGWATVMDGQGIVAAGIEQLQDAEFMKTAREAEAPLLGCLLTEDRRVACLAFDPLESNWVLRISFPLFVKNCTHWLTRPGGVQRAEIYRTGETLRVQFDRKISGVKLTRPDGGSDAPAVMGPEEGPSRVYFSDTYECGIYKVAAAGDKDRLFAVSLLSSAESDNRARDTIALGEETVAAKSDPATENTDLWPYVVLAALAFLLLEWYVYNKRVLG